MGTWETKASKQLGRVSKAWISTSVWGILDTIEAPPVTYIVQTPGLPSAHAVTQTQPEWAWGTRPGRQWRKTHESKPVTKFTGFQSKRLVTRGRGFKGHRRLFVSQRYQKTSSVLLREAPGNITLWEG